MRSLAWAGDALIDLVYGGRVHHLDGSVARSTVFYAYRFDRASIGPSGWAALYERLGTKALLLRHGAFVRELDRSYYFANVTPFPIALVERGERVLVIHAPDEYNRLEIEDAETGERVTERDAGSADFFHSRLALSPDGRWLASAGWVWHPFESLMIYDLDRALAHPAHLDGDFDALFEPFGPDVDAVDIDAAAAAFDERGRLVFAATTRPDDPERARSWAGVIDPSTGAVLSRTECEATSGTLMPVGDEHVVIFTDRPRLVRLSDGAVVHTFEDIVVAEPPGCIPPPDAQTVPLAIDVAGRRFAVAGSDAITIVRLGTDPSEPDE